MYIYKKKIIIINMQDVCIFEVAKKTDFTVWMIPTWSKIPSIRRHSRYLAYLPQRPQASSYFYESQTCCYSNHQWKPIILTHLVYYYVFIYRNFIIYNKANRSLDHFWSIIFYILFYIYILYFIFVFCFESHFIHYIYIINCISIEFLWIMFINWEKLFCNFLANVVNFK